MIIRNFLMTLSDMNMDEYSQTDANTFLDNVFSKYNKAIISMTLKDSMNPDASLFSKEELAEFAAFSETGMVVAQKHTTFSQNRMTPYIRAIGVADYLNIKSEDQLPKYDQSSNEFEGLEDYTEEEWRVVNIFLENSVVNQQLYKNISLSYGYENSTATPDTIAHADRLRLGAIHKVTDKELKSLKDAYTDLFKKNTAATDKFLKEKLQIDRNALTGRKADFLQALSALNGYSAQKAKEQYTNLITDLVQPAGDAERKIEICHSIEEVFKAVMSFDLKDFNVSSIQDLVKGYDSENKKDKKAFEEKFARCVQITRIVGELSGFLTIYRQYASENADVKKAALDESILKEIEARADMIATAGKYYEPEFLKILSSGVPSEKDKTLDEYLHMPVGTLRWMVAQEKAKTDGIAEGSKEQQEKIAFLNSVIKLVESKKGYDLGRNISRMEVSFRKKHGLKGDSRADLVRNILNKKSTVFDDGFKAAGHNVELADNALFLQKFGKTFKEKKISESDRYTQLMDGNSEISAKRVNREKLIKLTNSVQDTYARERMKVSFRNRMKLGKNDDVILGALSKFMEKGDEATVNKMVEDYANKERRHRVLRDVARKFMTVELLPKAGFGDILNITDDAVFAEHADYLERASERARAFATLLKENPDFKDALNVYGMEKGRTDLEIVTGRLDRMLALSDYYRARKCLILNTCYTRHYKSIIGDWHMRELKRKEFNLLSKTEKASLKAERKEQLDALQNFVREHDERVAGIKASLKAEFGEKVSDADLSMFACFHPEAFNERKDTVKQEDIDNLKGIIRDYCGIDVAEKDKEQKKKDAVFALIKIAIAGKQSCLEPDMGQLLRNPVAKEGDPKYRSLLITRREANSKRHRYLRDILSRPENKALRKELLATKDTVDTNDALVFRLSNAAANNLIYELQKMLASSKEYLELKDLNNKEKSVPDKRISDIQYLIDYFACRTEATDPLFMVDDFTLDKMKSLGLQVDFLHNSEKDMAERKAENAKKAKARAKADRAERQKEKERKAKEQKELKEQEEKAKEAEKQKQEEKDQEEKKEQVKEDKKDQEAEKAGDQKKSEDNKDREATGQVKAEETEGKAKSSSELDANLIEKDNQEIIRKRENNPFEGLPDDDEEGEEELEKENETKTEDTQSLSNQNEDEQNQDEQEEADSETYSDEEYDEDYEEDVNQNESPFAPKMISYDNGKTYVLIDNNIDWSKSFVIKDKGIPHTFRGEKDPGTDSWAHAFAALINYHAGKAVLGGKDILETKDESENGKRFFGKTRKEEGSPYACADMAFKYLPNKVMASTDMSNLIGTGDTANALAFIQKKLEETKGPVVIKRMGSFATIYGITQDNRLLTKRNMDAYSKGLEPEELEWVFGTSGDQTGVVLYWMEDVDRNIDTFEDNYGGLKLDADGNVTALIQEQGIDEELVFQKDGYRSSRKEDIFNVRLYVPKKLIADKEAADKVKALEAKNISNERAPIAYDKDVVAPQNGEHTPYDRQTGLFCWACAMSGLMNARAGKKVSSMKMVRDSKISIPKFEDTAFSSKKDYDEAVRVVTGMHKGSETGNPFVFGDYIFSKLDNTAVRTASIIRSSGSLDLAKRRFLEILSPNLKHGPVAMCHDNHWVLIEELHGNILKVRDSLRPSHKGDPDDVMDYKCTVDEIFAETSQFHIELTWLVDIKGHEEEIAEEFQTFKYDRKKNEFVVNERDKNAGAAKSQDTLLHKDGIEAMKDSANDVVYDQIYVPKKLAR